ncbi:hypothetical protein GCM10026983_03060 [Gracilibacillus alcaliphilus]
MGWFKKGLLSITIREEIDDLVIFDKASPKEQKKTKAYSPRYFHTDICSDFDTNCADIAFALA